MSQEESNEEPSSLSIRIADLWAMAQMQWHIVALTAGVFVTLALLYTLFATREYRSTAVLHLSTVAGREMDVEGALDLDTLNRANRQMFVLTQLEILRSRPMREEIIRQYNDAGFDDLTPDNGGIERLSGLLTATPRAGSELLDLSVTYTDPERAAALANVAAKVFVQKNLEARISAEAGGVPWLTEQIATQKGAVDAAAGAFMAYKAEHQLADIGEDTSTIQAQLSALNLAHGDVAKERVVIESSLRAHEALWAKGQWSELAFDLPTPAIQTLQNELATKRVAYSSLSERYGPNMPESAFARAAVDSAEVKLQAEVRRSLDAERAKLEVLRMREASLVDAIGKKNLELLSRQSLRTEYDMLSGELERSKKAFDDLNRKLLETTLAAQTQRNNMRIVDQARPNRNPVAPDPLFNAFAGLVIGLVAGVSLAVLREQVDDSITSPLDVTTWLRVPYLGMIPKISSVTDETELALYTFQHPTSSAAEAIRAIRTLIELLPKQGQIKRLMVTSALSSEGKTSTIVRLGVAFANLGRRVVMVDGDLRRPRIHKIFQIDREPGLTSLLEGGDIDEVVQPTGVPNLFFIPAGAPADHSAEPLAAGNLDRLLEDLDQRYDLVLIDTPPAALLSDAAILSKRVDGVVMLVREATASRQVVRDALRSLNKVGANILGVVINAVDPQRRRGGKYYSYYYGYNYRYNRYYSDATPENPAAK